MATRLTNKTVALPVEETGRGSETPRKHPFVHADGLVHSLSPLDGVPATLASRGVLAGRATVLFVKRVAMADDLSGWRLGW